MLKKKPINKLGSRCIQPEVAPADDPEGREAALDRMIQELQAIKAQQRDDSDELMVALFTTDTSTLLTAIDMVPEAVASTTSLLVRLLIDVGKTEDWKLMQATHVHLIDALGDRGALLLATLISPVLEAAQERYAVQHAEEELKEGVTLQ